MTIVAACGGKAVLDGDSGHGGASSSSSQTGATNSGTSTGTPSVVSTGTGVVPSACETLCGQLELSCNPSSCLSRCSAPAQGCEPQKATAVNCALDNLEPMSCNIGQGCSAANEALATCKYGPGGATGCSIGGPPGQCDCLTEYGNDEFAVACMPGASGVECTCTRNNQLLGNCNQDGDPNFACSLFDGSCCASIFAAEL